MSHAADNLLLSRCFTAGLQKDFSRLSGDYNPLHDDPISARRTIVGGQAVHGMHQALAAMEVALARLRRDGSANRGIAGFTALFQKPVLVGETVHFHLTESTPEKWQIAGKIEEDPVCQIVIRW